MSKIIDLPALLTFKKNIIDFIYEKFGNSNGNGNIYKITLSTSEPETVTEGEIVMVCENTNSDKRKILSIWMNGNNVLGEESGDNKEPSDPGLYDADGVMLASWDELINDYGLDITIDHASPQASNESTNALYTIIKNENLELGVKLIIGDINKIGNYALYNCSSLTCVEMPNSVTTIGESAFRACSSLTCVEIPDSIKVISAYMFQDCSSLISVVIPSGVTNIANYAFYNCSSLTSIEMSDSINLIGMYAFRNCQKIKSIYIPESVKYIYKYIFYDCLSTLRVCCGAKSKQSGWDSEYDTYTTGKKITVKFGITRDVYESSYKL